MSDSGERGGLESAAEPGSVPERQGGATTHFPCFDGLRAIAAWSVMITHVALISGVLVGTRATVTGFDFAPYLARLDIGVAVFFLISGFLLYRPFVVAHLAHGRAMRYGAFMKRRALRIFPAYWACLTVVAFVLRAPAFEDAKAVFLHYALLHVYSADNVIFGPVQQSWTLATELAFYLLLPAYAWVLGHKQREPRRQLSAELAGVTVLYAISLAFRGWLLADGTDRFGMYVTWLPAQLDLFALGMGLAAASAWLARDGRDRGTLLARPFAPAISWTLALVAFWVLCTRIGLSLEPFPDTAGQHLGRQFLFGVVAFFVLLPAIFGPQDRGFVRALLRNPVVQWMGLVSYGIYLWHEAWLEKYLDWTGTDPFFAGFGEALTAVVALTLLSAAVSYYAVERPALRLKDHPLLRRRRPVTTVSR